MAKLALQAALWYNDGVKMLLLQRCWKHPEAWTHLDWRCIVNTLPPHAQDGNLMKVCSKCKQKLPATPEFFHRHKSNKDGFQPYCKQCRSRAKPRHVPQEGYRQCSKCKQDLPATLEYFKPQKEYKGRKPRLSSHCKQCVAQANKSYVANNREKVQQRKKEYQATHKEQRKTYDTEHKEQIYNNRKRYIEENRERIRELRRTYYASYYSSDRGRVQMRVSSSNRRARKRNAKGTYTTEELYQQLHRQKSKCYYCHKKLGESRNSWVAEHVIPLIRGGHNSIDNIVIACPECNLSKGSKLPHEWQQGGRLL